VGLEGVISEWVNYTRGIYTLEAGEWIEEVVN